MPVKKSLAEQKRGICRVADPPLSAPERARTSDLAFRKRLLYPAELRGRPTLGI